MPVLLLILGVSLVGVAAIFFLVLAWNVADIRMRALIIGGITLATMVVASLLRRWSLRATAEAFGALGVILLGLDAWAVQANDLFGAQAMDAVVYAGIATLAVGAVCRLWAVISRLRGPDLAATLALPTGLGLLIAGLVPLEPAGAVTAGLLGTAVGGLAHALPAPWSAARSRAESIPERTALAVIGVAALVGGAATSLLLGLESMAVQLVAAGVVIVVGAAYTVLLRPREDVEPLPARDDHGTCHGRTRGSVPGVAGMADGAPQRPARLPCARRAGRRGPRRRRARSLALAPADAPRAADRGGRGRQRQHHRARRRWPSTASRGR